MNTVPDQKSRLLGGLWGSLTGDALGVPVEFQNRAARVADPVTGMRGYGTHHQPPGTWSDDGALLLCSVESLVERGFDTADMAARFVRWERDGLWTANGDVFDIGIATSEALRRVRQGVPAEEAGGKDEYSNGNGSLMRILPVVLASLKQPDSVFQDRIQRASKITHGHPRSQLACVFFGLLVRAMMEGWMKEEAVKTAAGEFSAMCGSNLELPAFGRVLRPDFRELREAEINSGGYVIDTLEAAVWCLLTTGGFAECVLQAVNLGGDTDTTGCVAGGLAGVCYGEEAIAEEWLAALPRGGELMGLFDAFRQVTASPISMKPRTLAGS
ncbi:MAG: ADP-ribosylglycohydrolase family protein [Verrucomicrobiota bacterium]